MGPLSVRRRHKKSRGRIFRFGDQVTVTQAKGEKMTTTTFLVFFFLGGGGLVQVLCQSVAGEVRKCRRREKAGLIKSGVICGFQLVDF